MHEDGENPKPLTGAKKRQKFGQSGETLAAQFLENKGWDVLERNWRNGRRGEVDIIALDPEGHLVFIEIKTRRTYCRNDPREELGFQSVHGLKQNKIINLALHYLARHGRTGEDKACRFDVIVVHFQPAASQPELTHVRDAFPGLSWGYL